MGADGISNISQVVEKSMVITVITVVELIYMNTNISHVNTGENILFGSYIGKYSTARTSSC